MKKWIVNLGALMKTLGFSKEKVQGGLTATEWKQVREAYATTYGTSLDDDKAKNEDAAPREPEALLLSDDEKAAIADCLGVETQTIPGDGKAAAMEAAEAAKQAKQEAAAALKAKAEAEKALQQMAQEPEKQEPAARATAKAQNVFGARHTESYLYGIEHDLFSRKKWYNQLATDAAHRPVSVSEEERQVFEKDFKAASAILKERMEQHRANGTYDQLDLAALAAGEGRIDYADPTNKLGEHIVRRTDAILAYFKTLPTVTGIFPVRSNVQNKEAAVSAIIGELSQGYRKGRIFKGGMQFSAGTYKVDDLMFKFNFEDLVDLEKQYIGYLNKDHSAIIKWTFIEWVMVHYGEQLVKEQNERRVIGVRVPQQQVVANPGNLAGDGALRAIVRAVRENRVMPFSEIGAYDKETMLDTVEAFADRVQEVAGSTENLKIFINAKHKRWYIRAYRQKYGQDADFNGSHATLADLDPSLIVWVPNMRLNDYLLWAAEPGNVELLEDKPGEMLAFEFTPEFEGVLVKSRWKEGAHVEKAGAPFKTQAELKASGFKYQFIYVSNPASELTLAATIDVAANTLFAFTGDTAVTTVNGAADDRVITLVAKAAGDELKKSGAFSKIESVFTAGAAGDWIDLYPELEDTTTTVDGVAVKVTTPTGKWLELDRHVTSA